MDLKRSLTVVLLIIASAVLFAGAAKFLNRVSKNSSINEASSTPEGLHPEFAAYISGYTSGFIHSDEGIKIRFTEAVIDSGAVGEEVVPNPFKLNVACKAYWDDDRTIICKPEKTWERNTVIEGKFKLDNYFKIVNEELELFPIRVQTMPQEAQVAFKKWISTSVNSNEYDLEVAVNLIDGAENKDLEEAFVAKLGTTKLSGTWNHHSRTKHTIIIRGIKRTSAVQTLEATIDLDKIGGEESLASTFEVPAQNQFQCWQVKADREKGITLSFNENIVSADQLNGLFYSEKFTVSSIEVVGTEVFLYGSFDEYIYGDFQIKLDGNVKSTAGNSLGNSTYLSVDLGGNLPGIKEEFNGNNQYMYPVAGNSKFSFSARGLKSALLVINEVEMSQIENSLTESYSELTGIKGKEVVRKVVGLGTFSTTRADGYNLYHLDLNTLFPLQPGKGYQVNLSFSESDLIEPCNNDLASIDPLKDPAFSQTDNYYDYYYGESSVMQCIRQKGGNNSESTNFTINSFFLKTNIGLIVKKLSNFKTAVFAVDIMTGGPKAGTTVNILSNRKKVVGTGTTNTDGLIVFTHSENAAIVKATDGSSTSMLPINSNYALSAVSNYSLEGTGSDVKAAYLFSERDIYRPGDSIHYGIILPPKAELNAEEQRLPIVLEVTDSKGSKVLSKVIAKNNIQMHRYSLPTRTTWPTGTYRSTLSIGNKVTYRNIKLEATKPNRLNISLKETSDFLVNNSSSTFNLQSTYLFGAKLTNGKALVTGTATDIPYTFEKFADYTFYGNTEGKSENVVLFEGKLGAEGTVNLDWTPNLKGINPQLIKLTTTVFEESGEPSVEFSTKVVFPTANAIGIKPEKVFEYGSPSYTRTEPIKLNYVFLSKGKLATPLAPIILKVFKQNQRSWYNGESDTYTQQNENLESQVFSGALQWKNKGDYTFDIPTQFADGEYRFEFVASDGSAKTNLMLSINEYASGSKAMNANEITLSTDKESYTTDNTINLAFNSPKKGMALVTYERGNQLIGQQWVNVVSGTNNVLISPTPEMAPGIYVSVNLMQEYASSESAPDLLRYGLKYVEIGNKGSKLIPEITVPDKVLPEANTEITVKEKEGKPMTYMLAIVDEGLLNMTSFSAPNSYNYFYGKHTLGVESYENLSRFVNAQLAQFSNQATGGSDMAKLKIMDGTREGIADLEAAGFRFKPLVKVLGPFKLGAKDSEKHTFNAEGYIGAVRVMVVAANDRNFGAAEKLVVVSSDLMIQGAAPRLVGPADLAKVPISLFGKKGLKNANITFTVKGEGKLAGSSSKKVTFTNERATAFIDVAATGKTGIIKIEAVAKSGKWQHTWKVNLPVRSALSRQTTVNTLALAPGESKAIAFGNTQPEGKPIIGLEINSLPKLQIEKHLNYLLEYPYGCLEQTISGAFPQIYLSKLTQLDNSAKNKAAFHVKEAISKLNSFRSNVSDGFTYWPGTNQTEPWANLYALHFLQVAKAEGFVVPNEYNNLLANSITTVQKNVNLGATEGQTYIAYAAYIASLSSNEEDDDELINTFAIPTANALIQRSDLTEEARLLCALTLKNYQVAGPAMNAKVVLKASSITFSNPLRVSALRLLVSSQLNKNSAQSFEIANNLVTGINNSNWYNTQTVAWSMIALSAYSDKFGGNSATAAVTIGSKPTENISLNGLSWSRNIAPRNANKGVTVKNTGKGTLYINAVTNTLPKPGEEKNNSSQMDVSIAYIGLNGAAINPANLSSGTSFKAIITVRQKANLNTEHAAINFRIPGGWELDNSRLANDTDNPYPNTEYTDIRDDRMSIFLGMRAGEVRTFEVGLKATYAGKYFMPGLQAEDMYQTYIRSSKAGSYVVVTQ